MTLKRKNRTLPETLEIKRQRLNWPSPLAAAVLLLAIAADLLNFYQLFALNLENSALMCLFLSLVGAAAVDVLPFLASNLLSRERIGKNERAVALACYGAALGAFLITFIIRVSSAGELFEGSYSIVQTGEAAPLALHQIAIAVLLGFVPLCTTLLVAAVTLTDVRRKKRALLRRQKLQLREELDRLETIRNLIAQDLSEGRRRERDEERYRAALAEVEAQLLSGRELARSILARLLGSADDCSVLLEEEDDALHASVRARLTALGIGGGRAAS